MQLNTQLLKLDTDIVINHTEVANSIIEPLINGSVTPIEMYALIRHIKAIVEIAENSIKDEVVDYMEKNYSKEVVTKGGIEIKTKKGASKATFPNNPLIEETANRLKALQEIAKTLAKTRQKEVADTETGELIYPAQISYNKDTVEIKFIK
ncbi:hypothetical protein KC678_04815 [Candidatus Dojkabacteria bacterium]|uniref:Uncharacterized protein n=1 Tax=Candidatus Dojkabacteria bacterium TaxID=2099670 RepID=A0A955L295_9BACT|nr:hypothetical protein [Candidatus Dojkabacteria bacterium]